MCLHCCSSRTRCFINDAWTQVRVFHRVHVNHRPISAPGWRVRGAAGPAPAPLAPASARLRQPLCSPNSATASCASFSVPPTLLLHGLRFIHTHARGTPAGPADKVGPAAAAQTQPRPLVVVLFLWKRPRFKTARPHGPGLAACRGGSLSARGDAGSAAVRHPPHAAAAS